jgi:hAT family C-terminal dimerisation region
LKDLFKPQIRNALELNYSTPANIMQPFAPQFSLIALSQCGALLNALEKVEDSRVVQLTGQKLKGETEVCQQKWMSVKVKNVKLPKTAMDALAACNPECYPNVYHLLQILVTSPVSVASAELTFSTQ